MNHVFGFAALASMLCACGGSVASSSSKDGSDPGAPATTSSGDGGGPCMFSDGPYSIAWTASGGPDCTSGSGTYLFQWATCEGCAGSFPGNLAQLTTHWPPDSSQPEEDGLSIASDGQCQLSGTAPAAVADGGVSKSTTTYTLTADGFTGKTIAKDARDTPACTYVFSATLP
jgi:hypothetical protein